MQRMRWSGQDVSGAGGFAFSSRPPRCDFDEAQSQLVELGDGKARSPRHRGAQAPHQPVGANLQEQPEVSNQILRDFNALLHIVNLP